MDDDEQHRSGEEALPARLTSQTFGSNISKMDILPICVSSRQLRLRTFSSELRRV